jgi:hypothetical protein
MFMSGNRRYFVSIIILGSAFVVLLFLSSPVNAGLLPQQATVGLATVTGTPAGPMVIVRSGQEQFINVRSGPGIFFPKIGVLLIGQKAPAIGRSAGGDWIIIHYEGVPGNTAWVYAPFVDVTPGNLPIVEPPPTPTPLQTSTIDPTLAAQFVVTAIPTRLPTYTPPAVLAIPTFTADGGSTGPGNIPMGLIIFALAAIGVLTGLFSLAQRR